MEQPKKLLVAVLVSSLVSNVILICIVVAALTMAHKLNAQLEEIRQRIDYVRQIVDTFKAARVARRERGLERRQDEQGYGEEAGTPRRPPFRQRLRQDE